MRLAQHTDYGIRVLIYAAVLWPTGKLASIPEIAQAYGISQNHLMKVVHRLGLLGLLHTQRGRNGGLRLTRDPSTLRLGQVVKLLEADMTLVVCSSDTKPACPLAGMCRFASALDEAKAAFLDALDRYTLADAAEAPRGGGSAAVIAWLPR
ncbi:MAG TPA: Rrf2 family transcriptional regulator [Burkholderiaceae bacterium]|nr:Rrf2 family transcriptional regulator [Burkholderiaceae bacterium]